VESEEHTKSAQVSTNVGQIFGDTRLKIGDDRVNGGEEAVCSLDGADSWSCKSRHNEAASSDESNGLETHLEDVNECDV
jgi:hypothetical protein